MDFDKSLLPNLEIKIAHRNWQIALSQAFALLVSVSPGEVVCITGPSRGGKSKLIEELIRLLCGDDQFATTGLLPVVVVEAVNTGPNGTFSTKSFTQRMLEAVNHPILSMSQMEVDDPFTYQKMDRSTEGSLRAALERAFKHRKTRYLFIDEAQHAKYVSKSTQAAHAVIDSWKCLAQTAGLVLVIVGAYPVLDILKNSPHLLGRKHQVHLPRYHMSEEDVSSFLWILEHFEQVLRLDNSIPSLTSCGELLYEGSLGCIGLVKSWLRRAAAFAAIENKGITEAILKQTMLSNADREAIALEIYAGEKLLESTCFVKPTKKETVKPSSDKKGKAKAKTKAFKSKPKRKKTGNRTEVGND